MKYQSFPDQARFDPAKFIHGVDLLYDRSYMDFIYALMLVAILTCLLLWQIESNIIISFWFLSYAIVSMLRYVTYRSYKKQIDVTVQSSSIWFLLLLLGSLLSGGLWGAMGIVANIAFNLDYQHIILLNSIFTVTIAGLLLVSTIIHSSNIVLMMSFSLAALVPYCLYLFGQESTHLFFLGLFLTSFFILLQLIYQKIDINIYKLIRIRLLSSRTLSDNKNY